MKRFSRLGLTALMVVFLLAVLMPQTGQAAEYWKAKYERFSATIGETLAVGDAVYIKDTDGEAYKADADDSAARPAVGIVGKGGSSGTAEIVVRGILAGQTAASPGARLFLHTTAGAITATQPSTNIQALGFVLPGTTGTSTTYYISVVIPASPSVGY